MTLLIELELTDLFAGDMDKHEAELFTEVVRRDMNETIDSQIGTIKSVKIKED